MRLGLLVFVCLCLFFASALSDELQMDQTPTTMTTTKPTTTTTTTTTVAPKKKPAVILQPTLSVEQELFAAQQAKDPNAPKYVIPLTNNDKPHESTPLNDIDLNVDAKTRVSSAASVVGGIVRINSPDAVEADEKNDDDDNEKNGRGLFTAPTSTSDAPTSQLFNPLALDPAQYKQGDPILRKYFDKVARNPTSDDVVVFPALVKKVVPPPTAAQKANVEYSYPEIKNLILETAAVDEKNRQFPLANFSTPEIESPTDAPNFFAPTKDKDGNIIFIIPASAAIPSVPVENFTAPEYKKENEVDGQLTPDQQFLDAATANLTETPEYAPTYIKVPMNEPIANAVADAERARKDLIIRIEKEKSLDVKLAKLRDELRKAKLEASPKAVAWIRSLIARLTDAGKLDPDFTFDAEVSQAKFHDKAGLTHDPSPVAVPVAPVAAVKTVLLSAEEEIHDQAQLQIDELKDEILNIDSKLNQLLTNQPSQPILIEESNQVNEEEEEGRKVLTNLEASKHFVSRLVEMRKRRATS